MKLRTWRLWHKMGRAELLAVECLFYWVTQRAIDSTGTLRMQTRYRDPLETVELNGLCSYISTGGASVGFGAEFETRSFNSGVLATWSSLIASA